jgi:hypothetical protein
MSFRKIVGLQSCLLFGGAEGGGRRSRVMVWRNKPYSATRCEALGLSRRSPADSRIYYGQKAGSKPLFQHLLSPQKPGGCCQETIPVGDPDRRVASPEGKPALLAAPNSDRVGMTRSKALYFKRRFTLKFCRKTTTFSIRKY